MKLEDFIKTTGDFPVIEIELLLAGVPNPDPLKVQISRWEKAGKLIQLKRGIYLLAGAYRKIEVYEPYIASILKKPSYLSLEKALEYHGLIPEAVKVYTSVTTKRAAKFSSPAGVFSYRHIKNSLFWGYKPVALRGQTAFIATPEKALLDLIYLSGTKISSQYLEGLRLQNIEQINLDVLFEHAKKFKKPGMLRAAELIKKYIQSYKQGGKAL
jgi:predicted transcriptional regulator of viral defense system